MKRIIIGASPMKDVRYCLLGVIAVLLPLVPGCSCGQRNTQQVELAVTELVSEQGVADALITIGASQYQSGGIPCRNLTPEECLDVYAATRSFPNPPSSYGTYVGSTDGDGRVTLVVDSIAFCTGSGRPFDFDPCTGEGGLVDQVTRVDFYVRVETDEVSEILTVEFTPGNTVSGEFFEVTVVSVGEPVPVEDFD